MPRDDWAKSRRTDIARHAARVGGYPTIGLQSVSQFGDSKRRLPPGCISFSDFCNDRFWQRLDNGDLYRSHERWNCTLYLESGKWSGIVEYLPTKQSAFTKSCPSVQSAMSRAFSVICDHERPVREGKRDKPKQKAK